MNFEYLFQMNCDQALPVSSSQLTQYYCSKILQDLSDIQAAGFPYHTPDLMMEQGKTKLVLIMCTPFNYFFF